MKSNVCTTGVKIFENDGPPVDSGKGPEVLKCRSVTQPPLRGWLKSRRCLLRGAEREWGENFVAGYVYCVWLEGYMLASMVWHGYHGDRSYKGLPAYGDQHGTAPRHSDVPPRHARVCTLWYTTVTYHQGTLSKHDCILFHYQTRAGNCFGYFYGDDNPCQGEFKGEAFPWGSVGGKTTRHWYDKWSS